MQREGAEARGSEADLEHALHPWVVYLILPIFALANAGVTFAGGGGTGQQITAGILLGLVVGKPVGVLLFSWIATRVGMADLPEGVTWTHVLGVGFLAGIGFTMSLFIAGLSLEGAALGAAKLGLLAGSLAAGLVGTGLLLRTCREAKTEREPFWRTLSSGGATS